MPNIVRRLALALLLVLPAPALSAAAPQDSLRTQRVPSYEEQFRPQALIAPTLLLTGGFVGVYSPCFQAHINEPLRAGAANLRAGRYLPVDNVIQYVPMAAFVGLGFAVPSDHAILDRTLLACTAALATFAFTQSVKMLVGECRPDGSAWNSFPSGHTATAFVGAEMVRREYGPWWGCGAYAVATATALLRVYNERHWFNDLLGGAAFGILSANLAYWLLPLERRLFDRNPSRQTSLAVLPSVGAGNTAGLSLTLCF